MILVACIRAKIVFELPFVFCESGLKRMKSTFCKSSRMVSEQRYSKVSQSYAEVIVAEIVMHPGREHP